MIHKYPASHVTVILPHPYQLINQGELSAGDNRLRFSKDFRCFQKTAAVLILHGDVIITQPTNPLMGADKF